MRLLEVILSLVKVIPLSHLPCADRGIRRPSTNQEAGSHQTLNLPEPRS